MGADDRAAGVGVEGVPSPRLADHAKKYEPEEAFGKLAGHAEKYQLFQMISLLERLAGGVRLGEGARPETIRIRPSLSRGFPATDVERLERVGGSGRLESGPDLERADRLDGGVWQEHATSARQAESFRLTANLFGLVGADSPLPHSYLEELRRAEDDNPHMRDFLDIFHHRIFSFWYRSWLRHRPERAFRAGARDRLSRALLAQIGVDPDSSPEELGIAPQRLLRYVGLFLLPSRPIGALETFLSEELGVSVKAEQLTPRWVELPLESVYQIGGGLTGRGTIGADITIGTRMLDRSGHLKLRLGPMRPEKARAFHPDGTSYRQLAALTRLYLRQPVDLCVECRVEGGERGSIHLDGEAPPQIGVGTFIGEPTVEAETLRFEIDAARTGSNAPSGPAS